MNMVDEKKYPMTEEEFIKRVKELFLEESTWPMDYKLDYIQTREVQEDLKDLYEEECYRYDREESLGCEINPCFTDYSLGVHVSTLDLMA